MGCALMIHYIIHPPHRSVDIINSAAHRIQNLQRMQMEATAAWKALE